MEHKHTPGPWALQMAEDCPGRRLDEMVKWVVTANSHHLWICTGPTWDEEHDAEALANARLIAASPDLFTTLIALREYLSKCPPHAGDTTGAEWGRVMDLSGAAIIKATGSQP